MPITITIDDHTNPPFTFDISDDVIASLDQRRTVTLVDLQPEGVFAPRYNSVKEMIVGVVIDDHVKPSLKDFPTPRVAAARVALKNAQDACDAAERAEWAPALGVGNNAGQGNNPNRP